MGTDKARVKIGRRTMLGTIRREAEQLGVNVRVIRRDLVERCGPLGGIFTGLKTTEAEAVLFLACDMPLVSADLLRCVMAKIGTRTASLFVQSEGIGFPLVLRKDRLPAVEAQISAGEFSVHRLCKKLKGRVFKPNRAFAVQLTNVNSPVDLEMVRRTFLARSTRG